MPGTVCFRMIMTNTKRHVQASPSSLGDSARMVFSSAAEVSVRTTPTSQVDCWIFLFQHLTSRSQEATLLMQASCDKPVREEALSQMYEQRGFPIPPKREGLLICFVCYVVWRPCLLLLAPPTSGYRLTRWVLSAVAHYINNLLRKVCT